MISSAVVLLAVWGAMIALLGKWGLTTLMASNRCGMTYSVPHFSPVPVHSASVKGYSLLELEDDRTVESGQDKAAILFVPGHGGSALQARSLASHMFKENQGYSYFVLDFNGSHSGYHGSHIVAQATFLNEALSAIRPRIDDSRGVIIVAHSMGGMVARTAMSMMNHMECIVSDVILLSTPITRPSYSLDASVLDIYRDVNRAWRHSFFDQTPSCLASKPHNDSSTIPNGIQICPNCVAKANVISITGGDIDYLVPASLTQLRVIEPSERNLSAVEPKSIPLASAFKPKGGFVKYLFRGVKNVVVRAYRLVAADDGNMTCSEETCANEELTVIEPLKEEVEQVDPYSEYGNRDRQRLRVTDEIWSADILPHVQPKYTSLRSSMLSDVGFQVDHLAMLWCHQVLRSVHKILNQMRENEPGVALSLPLTSSSNGKDENPFLWLGVKHSDHTKSLSGVVKKKYLDVNYGKPKSVPGDDDNTTLGSSHQFIDPIAAIMRRSAEALIWKRAASDERADMVERFNNGNAAAKVGGGPVGHVVQLLHLGWVVSAALIFVSQRLQTICVVYTLISSLAVISLVLSRISSAASVAGKKKSSRSALGDWFHIASPGVHLLSDFWFCVVAAVLGEKLLSLLCGLLFSGLTFGKMSFLSLNTKAFLNISLYAMVLALVANRLGYFSFESVDLIHSFGPLLEWSAAYGLALIVWSLVGVLLYISRQVVNVLLCAPLKSVFSAKKSADIDVEAIRKARVAAAAAAGSSRSAGVWSYLSGVDDSHLCTIRRPSALVLSALALIPLVLAGIVVMAAGTMSSVDTGSIFMRTLCAGNLVNYCIFCILWLATALLPAASERLPQWYRESSLYGDAAEGVVMKKAQVMSAELMLSLSAGLLWPLAVLGYPGFEFSVSILFDGFPLLSYVAAMLEKIGLVSVGQFLLDACQRVSNLHQSGYVLKDLHSMFGPGLIYSTAALYVAIMFLVISRSEPICDHIRPVAWLCEIQAVGTTVIKKVMKKYSNAGTVSSKGRQRVGQRAASSSIFENESTPKDKGRKAPKTVDDGSCCHEDGGKYAIFEQFNEYGCDVSNNGNGSVLSGPVYRVVSCRCFDDASLTKGRLEWCEWCRCATCGGKFDQTRTSEGSNTWISKFICVPDMNADLALLLGLVGAVAWTFMYVNDYLYRISHCVGLVCAAFCLHRVVLFFGY